MVNTHRNNDQNEQGSGPGLGAGDIAFLILLVLALVAVVLSGRFSYREGMLLETAKGNAQEFMKWADSVAAAGSKAEPFTLALCGPKPADLLAESAAKVVPEGDAGLPAFAKDPAEGASATAPAASALATTHAGAHGAPQEAAPVAAQGAAQSAAQSAAQAAAAGGPHDPSQETIAAKDAAKASAAQTMEQTAKDAAPDAPKVATTWSTCRESLFTAGGPLSHLSNPFDAVIPVASNKCERRNRATRGVVYIQKGTQPPPGVPGGTSWSPIDDDEPMVRGLMLRVQACDAGGYTINIGEVKL